MAFTINYTNGAPDQSFDTYAEAVAAVHGRFGADAEVGHDGDLEGFGDRTLFWADEESAKDDDGARALGSIRKEETSREESEAWYAQLRGQR